MIANKGIYLLSIIDHKHFVEFSNITLQIENSYENNFRERNPQLGRVEAVPEDNFLHLEVGDTVAVNHRTFYYAQIGENKGFVIKDHTVYDGVKLFRVLPEQMFLKYNNKVAEALPGFAICSNVEEKKELHLEPNEGKFYWTKEFSQRGTCEQGVHAGKEVLVLKNAFYLITLDKTDYFKVNENEIVAIIEGEEAIPVNGRYMVEYEEEKSHSFLDLSAVKKPNNVTATDENGRKLQVWRNQGVKWGDKYIIDNEMEIGEWI